MTYSEYEQLYRKLYTENNYDLLELRRFIELDKPENIRKGHRITCLYHTPISRRNPCRWE